MLLASSRKRERRFSPFGVGFVWCDAALLMPLQNVTWCLSALLLVTCFSCHAQADDDQVLGFHQTFLLKSFQGAWVCTNEVFRLALHNG